MRRAFAVLVLPLVLAAAGPSAAAVRVVEPFPVDRYADEGAIGLVVPGAGPTVTRTSALDALLTGKARSSILGGAQPGKALIALGEGPPPDVVVVLPPPGRSENDTRYPIALLGGGRGVLTSDSTRITGLVSITDVARGRLRVEEVDDPVATLERLERRIDRNDRIRLPLTLAVVVAGIAVALVRPRFGPRVLLLALAANLWLAGWWAVALLAAAALALPLGWACAAVVVAYLAAMGVDAEAVALSPLGPSQAGRFYGVSNLLETLMLVPSLLGTALLGRLGAVVAALAVVTVAGNRFGADGGGLLVLLAGYGALWLRLRSSRLGVRRALALAAAVVASALLLVSVDVALGGSSHVTDAIADGPGALLGDLADRLEISVRRSVSGAGPIAAMIASLAGIAVLATRRPRTPVADALLVALTVSLLVNDTPTDVVGIGVVGLLVVRRYELFGARAPGTVG